MLSMAKATGAELLMLGIEKVAEVGAKISVILVLFEITSIPSIVKSKLFRLSLIVNWPILISSSADWSALARKLADRPANSNSS